MDIKSLAQKIGIDKEEYKELIEIFIESATACTRRIEIYYRQRDIQAIAGSAHSLKGSAITMGLQDMHILFDKLEKDAKKGNLSLIPERIADIRKEVIHLSTDLNDRRKRRRM